MADLNDLLDPVRLENVIRGLEEISLAINNIDRESQRAGETFERNVETTDKMGKGFVDYGRVVKSTLTELGRSYQYSIRVEFLAATNDALNKAEARWKDYGREVRRQLSEARGGILGSAGGAMGVSGDRGAMRGAQAMFQQTMGNLPFGIGGILGLMLYGKKREQEFEAAAMRAGRIFDQIGGVGREQLGSLEGRIRAANFAWGSMGEEMQAVAAQLVQVGIGVEAFEKTGLKGGAFGDDLVGVITALETAYKLNPGSLAQQFGQVFEAGGVDRNALLNDFTNLAEIADRTGVNVQRLMATMTQGASALRIQRQGVNDLAESYIKLRSSFLQQGAYTNRAAAGAAAMQGVQAAASGLTGLPEGLMAELGRRMGAGYGVESIVRFQEGMAGRGKFAGPVFEELGKLAQEVTGGGSREEQIFALQKIAPSLGFEGARAVVDMMSGGTTLAEVRDSLKSPQEKMLDAFQRRSGEESAWEKVQRQIMLHMANIGSSLLTITMSGFDTLVTVIGALVPGSDVTAADASKSMVKFAGVQEQEGLRMLKALRGMAVSAGGGVDFVPEFLRDIEKSDAQKKKERVERITSDRQQTQGKIDEAAKILSTFEGFDRLSREQQTQARGRTMGAFEAVRPQESYKSTVAAAALRDMGLEVVDESGGGFRIIVQRKEHRGEAY